MSPENKTNPIAPYQVLAISTPIYGIAKRSHIMRNLETIEETIHAAMSLVNINMPVRMITLPEGALTGFTDEIFDLPHAMSANELFPELPGPETEYLGRLAKLYNTYIIGQTKARWPEVMDDRFFNTLFVIGPNGELVHKAAKNHLWCREHSCTPHDVYDRWCEVFGDGIEAFYPVLKTDDIGNIGTICCSDGEYPEAVRALAFNGAEVVYRPSEAAPMTNNSYPGGGSWMVQNRGHAEFNSLYMICPNAGPVFVSAKSKHGIDVSGGNSHIVDFRGGIMAYNASGNNSYIAAVIDIEHLRQFRHMNLNSNWLKDLRTELFKDMYSQPIHPRNLWMNREPALHEEVDEIYRANMEKLYARGTWTKPAIQHPGATFQSSFAEGEEVPPWEAIREEMWGEWE